MIGNHKGWHLLVPVWLCIEAVDGQPKIQIKPRYSWLEFLLIAAKWYFRNMYVPVYRALTGHLPIVKVTCAEFIMEVKVSWPPCPPPARVASARTAAEAGRKAKNEH